MTFSPPSPTTSQYQLTLDGLTLRIDYDSEDFRIEHTGAPDDDLDLGTLNLLLDIARHLGFAADEDEASWEDGMTLVIPLHFDLLDHLDGADAEAYYERRMAQGFMTASEPQSPPGS